MCISFDLVIPLLGIYPKINGQDVYKRMFVTQLFIIEKKFWNNLKSNNKSLVKNKNESMIHLYERKYTYI